MSREVCQFRDGDPVWVRNFAPDSRKWRPGKIVRKEGILEYLVCVSDKVRLVYVDQLLARAASVVDCDIIPPDGKVPKVNRSNSRPEVNLSVPTSDPPVVEERNVVIPGDEGISNASTSTPVVTDTEVVNVPERRTSACAKKAPDRLIESM